MVEVAGVVAGLSRPGCYWALTILQGGCVFLCSQTEEGAVREFWYEYTLLI